MHGPFEAHEGAMREMIERQFEENRQRQQEEERQAEQQRQIEAQREAEEERRRAELENSRFYAENNARRQQQQQQSRSQSVVRRRPIVYDLDNTDPPTQNPVSLLQIREQVQIGESFVKFALFKHYTS